MTRTGVRAGYRRWTDEQGVIVHGKATLGYGSDVPREVRRDRRPRFRQGVALEIATGEYTFDIGLGALSRCDCDRR